MGLRFTMLQACNIFTKNGLDYILGDFLLQVHLVTLLSILHLQSN
jgi:hypothetical protein